MDAIGDIASVSEVVVQSINLGTSHDSGPDAVVVRRASIGRANDSGSGSPDALCHVAYGLEHGLQIAPTRTSILPLHQVPSSALLSRDKQVVVVAELARSALPSFVQVLVPD